MNWYHARRGQYVIQSKEIALDWGKLFLHPEHAESTAIHELMHGIVADFDFGQATENFFATSGRMEHLSEKDRESMKGLLFNSQEYVQEGSATLMQMLNLSEHMGKAETLAWASKNLPPDYRSKFDSLKFVFGISLKYRNFFSDVSVRLAMEAGIRKDARAHDIFRSPNSIRKFLSDPDRVPDE